MTLHPTPLARQKAAAGDLEGAFILLAEALKQNPGHPQLLDDCGVILQKRGDFAQAAAYHAQAVEHAVKRNETNLLSGMMLNLAIALTMTGHLEQAIQLYKDILTIHPQNARASVNLGVLLTEHDAAQAEKLFTQASALGDRSFELAMGMGNLTRQQARNQESLKWYEQAVAAQPNNKQAQFMCALMRGDNPSAPPPEHIAKLFDSYANTFETSLVGKLKYRTPELLMRAVENFLRALKEEYADLSAIDLGAGTGLMGVLLRPFVTRSIGVDLSEKMLQKAQEKNIYDDVICGDITQALQDNKGKFHLITAADTLVYLGDLTPIFAAAAASLKSGGVFAFSTESANEEEESDFALRGTGRYAHRESYLRRLAGQNDFTVLSFEKAWARYNKGVPLDGFIVVLKKI